MPARAKSKKRSKPLIPPRFVSYWQQSQQPLQALFFLLPLIFLYEIALPIYGTDQMRRALDIYARRLLDDFFELFGVTGHYLPALIVVVVLISWHMVRKDPWRFEPRTYALMYAESVILSLPLFVFLLVLAREPTLQQAVAARHSPAAAGGYEPTLWQAQMMFGIGAGIYEELLFRLIGIALVHAVLVDLLALPPKVGAVGAIGLTAVAFALYHFPDFSNIRLGLFLQYAFAGVYLAGVYLVRGFGIASGTHAAYDVLWVVYHTMQTHPH